MNKKYTPSVNRRTAKPRSKRLQAVGGSYKVINNSVMSGDTRSVPIDLSMSNTSKNAVANKVVKAYIDNLISSVRDQMPLRALIDVASILTVDTRINRQTRSDLYNIFKYAEDNEIPSDPIWIIDTNGQHYIVRMIQTETGVGFFIIGYEGFTRIEGDDTKVNQLLRDKADKAYVDSNFFKQAQFDPTKTHDYVKTYVNYENESPKTLELGVDLIIQDDIASAAEDDPDNRIFNNGLVTALGVKNWVSAQTTPDWDAAQGKTGYIANRPFYVIWHYKTNYISVSSSSPKTLSNAVQIGTRDFLSATVSHQGRTFACQGNFEATDGTLTFAINSGKKITFQKSYNSLTVSTTDTSNVTVEVLKTASPSNVFKLDDIFIPNTIARKTDVDGCAKLYAGCVVANGVLDDNGNYFYLPEQDPNNNTNFILATQGWVEGKGYLTSDDIGELYTKEEIDGLLRGIESVAVSPTLTSGVEIAKISVGSSTMTLYAPNSATLAGLMGGSAIGSTSSYIYWDGKKFATKSLGSLAFKSSVNKSDVGLGNVDNLAASGYFTALSSNATNAVSITIGGTTKSITVNTMKNSLGLKDLAYKTSVDFSDIANTPDSLSGYGIKDALSTSGGKITGNLEIGGSLTLGGREIASWDDIKSSGDYLPLTGGTISGDLLVEGGFKVDAKNGNYIQFTPWTLMVRGSIDIEIADGYSLWLGREGITNWAGLKTILGLKGLAYKDSVSFADIASKPTTLSGYGIKDAYTKTEVDDLIGGIDVGTDITVDSSLSTTSDNPVQNKVITSNINRIDEVLNNLGKLSTKDKVSWQNDIEGIPTDLGEMSIKNQTATSGRVTIEPNVLNRWTSLLSSSNNIEIVFEQEQSGVANYYMIEFKTNGTAPTIALPEDVVWATGYNVLENLISNKSITCQISILNNLAVGMTFYE